MGHYSGRVTEIRLEAGKNTEAWITCPAEAIPSAGQYMLVYAPADSDAALGTPVFAGESSGQGFWAAQPFPAAWGPGTSLHLHGPLGHGFDLPKNLQRLGLVALGETVSRLMPLVQQAALSNCAMTLFADLPLPSIPSSLEVYPLASLADALDWPDFLALDLPLQRLPELRTVFGIGNEAWLPWQGQALVWTPMPCAGMAQCGACAVPARRGWKLACEEGPVFDLKALKW
jgi:Iron-sulfur cluster binding domain of dihydroorotate dehydrogenase B